LGKYDKNELEKNKIKSISINVINEVPIVLSFDTFDDDGNVRHKH
jgi:hypothetical protein